MKKIRMCVDTDKTFAEGFEEYILDCKSRNLRDGTLRHYRESIKQIYKRVPPDTLISDLDEYTMPDFIVALRDDPNLNDVSMGTYARDLKTLMRFFMKCEYLPHFEIKIPKADKEAIETYTDAELKRLLKKPDIRKCGFVTYRSWVIVNFLLSTGIRQNSLINIKIKDLDFDNDMVYINTTKNRKSLIIPLNEDIVKILHEYLKYRGGGSEDWLFCSIYGEKMTKGATPGFSAICRRKGPELHSIVGLQPFQRAGQDGRPSLPPHVCKEVGHNGWVYCDAPKDFGT